MKSRYGTGGRSSCELAGVAPIIILLRSSTSATDLGRVVRINLRSYGQDEPSHGTNAGDNGVKPRIGDLKYFHQQGTTPFLHSLTSSTSHRDTLDARLESI